MNYGVVIGFAIFVMLHAGCKKRSQAADVKIFQLRESDTNAFVTADIEVYTQKNNQKVVLIDIRHVAPARYYSTVAEVIRLHHMHDPNLIILKESVRCQDDVVALKPHVTLVQALQTTDSAPMHDRVPESRRYAEEDTDFMALVSRLKKDLRALDQRWLTRLQQADVLTSVPCTLTKNGPGRLASGFQIAKQRCREAASMNKRIGRRLMACQETAGLFAGLGHRVINADVSFNDSRPIEQIIMNKFSNILLGGDADFERLIEGRSALSFAVRDLINAFIIDRRNMRLLDVIDRELVHGRKTIIVPWGQGHLPSIAYALRQKQLERRPFLELGKRSVENSLRVVYADCGHDYYQGITRYVNGFCRLREAIP